MQPDLVEERITLLPDLCGGRPTIRGMRTRVVDVLEMLGGGMTYDEILADYPELEREDILAALQFAARLAGFREVRYATAVAPPYSQ
jgi:uncharacterized protein (DUF433 family)